MFPVFARWSIPFHYEHEMDFCTRISGHQVVIVDFRIFDTEPQLCLSSHVLIKYYATGTCLALVCHSKYE